jgi:hypothetical protein
MTHWHASSQITEAEAALICAVLLAILVFGLWLVATARGKR